MNWLDKLVYAGGGIRTHKPVRTFVFETNAYTVPPHRLVKIGFLTHAEDTTFAQEIQEQRGKNFSSSPFFAGVFSCAIAGPGGR